MMVKTISISKEPVKTMGGLTVVLDVTVDEIMTDEKSVLLLPGADTWSDAKHTPVIKKAEELILRGGTVALAHEGFLDHRPHTSNDKGFLEMFAPTYKGKEFFIDSPSVADGNLITAASTGTHMDQADY